MNQALGKQKPYEGTVAVIGLGFIGLPLSLSFALKGTPVIGVDINEQVVSDINNGITHHLEYHEGRSIREILQEQLRERRFRATTDYAAALSQVEAIVVTVGVPVNAQGRPVMDYLYSAARSIGQHLRAGQTVVVRSTVVPGTTGGPLRQILEETSGLRAGEDFYLAYCSERIAEGKAFQEFESMPVVVAGVNQASTEAAEQIIALVTTKAPIYRASDMRVVETAKVFENVQRDVNIAMVQEFARFTEALGLDIYEVIEVANTHTRVNLLTPGPGVGGYCLPNALYYLLPPAEEKGLSLDLLRLARQINDDIPAFLVARVDQWVAQQGLKPQETRVAVLGLAMKDYSNDDRISPPVTITRMLVDRGYQVRAFDPAVPTRYDFKVDAFEEAIHGAHVVLILTRQEGIPFERIGEWRREAAERLFVLDTRHVYRAEELAALGLDYWSI